MGPRPHQDVRSGRDDRPRPGRRRRGLPRRRADRDHGPVGLGKVDAHALHGGPGHPTSGSVVIDGTEVSRLSQRRLTALRRTRIGFVFQSYNLVPTLTAAENITLPLDIARAPWTGRGSTRSCPPWASGTACTTAPPSSRAASSSGSRARALVSRPSVVFADEPTGNLDSRSSAEVLGFLRRSVDELGQTVVMVTHDPRAASYAHRVLFLTDGRITADLAAPSRRDILDALGQAEDD
ncbi:ATP-binding cassette domain-containing protein [Oerskovia sp. M15]